MSQFVKYILQRTKLEKRRSNYTCKLDDDIDRISCLPEELRVHILTFLRIDEAVRTCVLSKIWKNTWAFLPNLVFDFREFLPGGFNSDLSEEFLTKHVAKFQQLVNDVLQNRKASQLKYFILLYTHKNFCTSCDSEAFRGCILRALEFKPPFLCVCSCRHKLLNSYEIFTQTFLQEIFVGSSDGHVEIAPSSVHLPVLKKLVLVYVRVNDDFLGKVFSGCPTMEEFVLRRGVLNVSRISSRVLKKLFLVGCHISKDLELCTPLLSDLQISSAGQLMRTISLQKMLFLSRASFEFSSCINSMDFTFNGSKFINSLSNVSSLCLTLPSTKVEELFDKKVIDWKIFKNLKILNLGGWCLNSDSRLVAFFLHSPNLRMVTLRHHDPPEVVSVEILSWEEPKAVMVQQEQLEIVEIIKKGISDKWIDQLVKKLHVHVKTIRKIIII